MNTEQIKEMFASNDCLRNTFNTICAKNTLPENVISHYPQIFIINTDPLPNPGKHWICVILLDRSSSEYFDSVGDPENYHDEHLQRFIKANSHKCTHILQQLQSSTSDICGLYVIFFVVMRICYQIPMQEIYHMFGLDLKQNDKFVATFLFNLFNK